MTRAVSDPKGTHLQDDTVQSFSIPAEHLPQIGDAILAPGGRQDVIEGFFGTYIHYGELRFRPCAPDDPFLAAVDTKDGYVRPWSVQWLARPDQTTSFVAPKLSMWNDKLERTRTGSNGISPATNAHLTYRFSEMTAHERMSLAVWLDGTTQAIAAFLESAD